jgi:hypothetical protein
MLNNNFRRYYIVHNEQLLDQLQIFVQANIKIDEYRIKYKFIHTHTPAFISDLQKEDK